MTEDIIHRRWGTTSRQVNISDWKKGEWSDATGGDKKRIIEDPGHQKWWDYLGSDGKHTLEKYVEPAPVTENIEDEEDIPSERLLYDFIQGLGMEFCSDQFANEAVIYKKKYYELHGREIKAIISSMYYKENGNVFSNQAWDKIVNVLSNECILNAKYFPLRCYTLGEAMWYDGGDCIWRFHAGEAISYRTEDELCPVIFRRYPHQLPAPIKETNKTAKELIEEATKLFNIQDFRPETIPPLFCSDHPQPMLLITGDPGAAKSTFTLFIKMLVDPDQVDKLTMPDKKDVNQFGLHRQRFYLLLYDNIRSFYQEQSDELCRMITGGTSITRKLYTNGELYVMKGLPRIIGNGLRPEPSAFNDLLDRTLLYDMNRIQSSKPEKVIWNRLNEIIPELRYACLKDMSKALTLAYEQEFPKVPRMSEFALLGESLNVLWGGQLGNFIDWFNNKMEIAHAAGMDDAFTVVLTAYLEAHKNLLQQGLAYSTSEWRFKLEEWGKEVLLLTDAYGKEYKSKDYLRPEIAMCIEEKDFPKNAVWCGRRFRDISPLMAGLGYEVTIIRSSKENKVLIKLNK